MALDRSTFAVTESDLQSMVLESEDLPTGLEAYRVVREGVLDNDTMAKAGFAGSTADRFHQAGRINGYMREFGPPSEIGEADGLNFVAAAVAHLFDSPESVSGWMHNVFLKDFEENVGESIGADQQLLSFQRLEPAGFFDESVALKALQSGPSGPVSSTVVDFRVGRILGVAYVGARGDHERLELASQLGLALEQRIVRVALGTAESA